MMKKSNIKHYPFGLNTRCMFRGSQDSCLLRLNLQAAIILITIFKRIPSTKNW